jgi:hypothetical protein
VNKPLTNRAGYEAFLDHIAQIYEDSVGSKSMPSVERDELHEGRSRLRFISGEIKGIVDASPDPERAYRALWDLAAGSFIIGSRGVITEGAIKYTRASLGSAVGSARLEKNAPRSAEIDNLIVQHCHLPNKQALDEVNKVWPIKRAQFYARRTVLVKAGRIAPK